MRRHGLFFFAMLFAVFASCTDGSGPDVDSISFETSSALFPGGEAAIALEKSTNGADADVGPGPSIVPGDAVVWEYTVTNTGTEALMFGWVDDDKEGVSICEIPFLGSGESYSCTHEGVASDGSYANVGTAFAQSFSGALVQATDPSHYMGEDPGGSGPVVQEVEIRIKPGSDSPRINVFSKGRLPVAILASKDPEFNPLDIDPTTIRAGAEESVAPLRWGKGEDVNNDGLPDLMVHFQTRELYNAGLLEDGMPLVISGQLGNPVSVSEQTGSDGRFTGSDLVRLTVGSDRR